jgi:thymidylate synthase (FAD)
MQDVKTITFPRAKLPTIEYVHGSDVEPWLMSGSDAHFVAAARVSTSSDMLSKLREASAAGTDMTKKDQALLKELVKSQHSGPFAHGLLSVYIDAPLFVWQQIGTHPELRRSRESARYRMLRPRFYIPSPEAAVKQGFAYHPLTNPVVEVPDAQSYGDMVHILAHAYGQAWQHYESLRDDGISKEIARSVLPQATMSTGVVSASPLHWLRALSVRTQTDASARVSHVQAETADVFMAIDALMRERWPRTMDAFDEAGRVSP